MEHIQTATEENESSGLSNNENWNLFHIYDDLTHFIAKVCFMNGRVFFLTKVHCAKNNNVMLSLRSY